MKFGELFRAVLLVAVYMAPIGVVEGAEIRFRGECAPSAPILRLGDLAEIVALDATEQERLASLEVCPAPSPGQQLLLSSREVCDRLALKGVRLAQHTQSGASRITVSHTVTLAPKEERPPVNDALRQQAEKRARTAILEYLGQRCDATAAWQLRFTLTNDQVQWIVRGSAKPIVQGGAEPWTGSQQFVLTVATADTSHQVELAVTVSPAEQIVVANRAIGRGERLSEADVRLATPNYTVAPENALHSLDQVIGREMTRSLAVDSPITADLIQSPVVVRKRDIVTIYARSPGIRVRITGRATEDGALGDLILLESLSDRQTFFARVCGPQEAEIYARAPQAADVSPAVASSQVTSPRGK